MRRKPKLPAGEMFPDLTADLLVDQPSEDKLKKWRANCPRSPDGALAWIKARSKGMGWTMAHVTASTSYVKPPSVRCDQIKTSEDVTVGDAVFAVEKQMAAKRWAVITFRGPQGVFIARTHPFEVKTC
jgi:hypothetical protein